MKDPIQGWSYENGDTSLVKDTGQQNTRTASLKSQGTLQARCCAITGQGANEKYA